RRQLGVAERAGVDHQDRRVGAVGVVAVEIGRAVEAVLAAAAVGAVLDRVVFVERLDAVRVERRFVDEVAGLAGETRIGGGGGAAPPAKSFFPSASSIMDRTGVTACSSARKSKPRWVL